MPSPALFGTQSIDLAGRASRSRVSSTLLGLLLVLSTSSASAALPRVPEGFEIRLVAAVPAVQYPCQVFSAPDGALYVAENPMDQIGPADQPIDRILVFRDGRPPVVFADKLNAVFGMAWRDDSLYVMHMPYLSIFRDVDGDGKSDQRLDLFTNLGLAAGAPNMMNDHIVSGIQFGMDGLLYIAVGDKGVPRVTGPDDREVQLVGGGVLRCRPDGTAIEVFSSGTRNHLEPNLDARDNLFTYDNTDDGDGWWTRVTHHINGGYYGYPYDYHNFQYRMLPRMAEYGGGSPCGGVVYEEDAWPEPYRGRVIWAEWGKRKVQAFAMQRQGSSFAVKDVIDLVEPGEVGDFRPLDLTLSHDGKTLYIADWGMGGWGNKIEKLGRVYAVTHTGNLAGQPRGKDSDPLADQLSALAHPARNERLRAQAAIQRQGPMALATITRALFDPATPPAAGRHLVWVLDGIAGGRPEASMPLIEALRSPQAEIRAQAARALGIRKVPIAAEPIHSLLVDPDPAVRLEAIIALGRIADPETVPDLVAALGEPDRFLAFAARQALRRIRDWNRVRLALDKAESPGVRLGVLETLELVYELPAAQILIDHVRSTKHPESERARALTLLAQGFRKTAPWNGRWWGTRPSRGEPFAKVVEWEGTKPTLLAIREALSDPAANVRNAAIDAVLTTKDQGALQSLRDRFAAETLDETRRKIALALGTLKDYQALPILAVALRDTKSAETVRDAALSALESIGTERASNTLLELLQSPDLDESRQPRVIEALGRFQSKPAVPTLLEKTRSSASAVRRSAINALGRVGGDAPVREAILRAFSDPDTEVKTAAIQAVASLKERSAIPALLQVAEQPGNRFEATLALAAIPDPRALGIYLQGLTDRSLEIRRASSEAIGEIKATAAPVLDQLASKNQLPPNLRPELLKIFTSRDPVTRWQVAGPFKIDDDTPLKPAGLKAIDSKTSLKDAKGQEIPWKAARPVDRRGQIDFGRLYGGDEDRAAYAFAEIDSPAARNAQLIVGSDDTLTLWLNGEKVYEFLDRRGFDHDQTKFEVKLQSGKNLLVAKCGNRGGGWQMAVAVSETADHAFLRGSTDSKGIDPESFRTFAQTNRGDAKQGKAIFQDLKGLACVKCHAVGGEGGKLGPDLSDIATKYPREELITAVLYPSAKISSGYEPVTVATTDGRVITGIIKSDTADHLELEDAEVKRVSILKSDIDARKNADLSIMPAGLVDGLTPTDFASLISYLETLKK